MLAFRIGVSARHIAEIAQRLPDLQPRSDAAHVIDELVSAERRILKFARERARLSGMTTPGSRERRRAA